VKVGDILKMNDTRLEVIETKAEPERVRVRYVAPHASMPVQEWYEVASLLNAGWRVVEPIFGGIPAVEVPPCRDV
jgi:hypothetical protein